MAENKKSFVAYADWKDTFDALPDEMAGQLIKFIFAYVNDENPTSDNVLINAVFPSIRNTLKRDLAKWNKQHLQRIKAGKKSAEVRKRNATSVERSLNGRSVSSTVSVSGSVSVSDSVSVKSKLSIEDRKRNFKKLLTPFLEKYSKDILNDFFGYWTEHGVNDKKMRYEKQKSFSIERRLTTWLKNQKKFDNKPGAQKTEKKNAAEILKQKYGLS